MSADESQDKNPLIGTWSYVGGGKMTARFNSRARIKTVAGDTICLGDYSANAGMISIDYDGDQPGCVGGTMGFQLADGGNTLQLGIAARYERVDAEDDKSF